MTNNFPFVLTNIQRKSQVRWSSSLIICSKKDKNVCRDIVSTCTRSHEVQELSKVKVAISFLTSLSWSYRLALPGFTGKEVLYWTKREYKSYKLDHDSNVVIPSLKECGGDLCVCSGRRDCNNMLANDCLGEKHCTKNNVCICDTRPGGKILD